MNKRFNRGDFACNCCQFKPIVSPEPRAFFRLIFASPVTSSLPDCSFDGRKPTRTFTWLLFFSCKYRFTTQPVPNIERFHGCCSCTYGNSLILLLILCSFSVW